MQPNSLNTRPALVDDIDALYDLICALAVYERKDPATLPLTKENLLKYGFGETPFFQVELAEKEAGIIGYALYFYGFSAHQGAPYLYLEDLFILPEERNRGAGTRLLKQLAIKAKERGCCRMEWHVFDWNKDAQGFYESLEGTLRKDLLLVRMEKSSYYQLAN